MKTGFLNFEDIPFPQKLRAVRLSLKKGKSELKHYHSYPIACSKKIQNLNFILQLCPGLCIYVNSHQKKFQDFWGIL